MAIALSPHHYFAIFLFIINAAAATVASIRKPVTSYPVDFTVDLNVDELDKKSYENFITDLRTKLAKRGGTSINVPILPSYVSAPPPHLFDVLLKSTKDKVTHEVTVRARRDNLYVRGYRMQTNNWMELREDKVDKVHMIDGSTFLEFTGSYKDMEGQAGTSVTEIKYSKNLLKKAVETLAQRTDTPHARKNRGEALIVMAQMISEAARLKQVSDHFASNILNGVKVPQLMQDDLQNNWQKLSKTVQCYDKFKEKYKYVKQNINGRVYNTVGELRTIFGVILAQPNLTERKCQIKKLAYEDEGEAAVVLKADI